MRTPAHRLRLPVALAMLSMPAMMGAEGDGCAANLKTDAPNVAGTWALEYDDALAVQIKIGGATYTEELGAQGGVIEIEHEGMPLTFDLNCDREEVLCPSEAWPSTIRAEQRDEEFEHRMIVLLPTQVCDGDEVVPPADECGPGTLNEECEAVCDGEMVVEEQERHAVIGADGDSFRLFLGAGIATNGINCALLAVSVADAMLETTGSARRNNWEATAMTDGVVTMAYAGGCLWADDVDMDDELEALVLGAEIQFTTGFTGQRL